MNTGEYCELVTVALLHNLHGQVLDSILLHVDSATYVHKANMYNHVKAGGLRDCTKKKFVIDS